MWPKLLDHTREQCLGVLRNLECTAYSSVVDAFRAGGDLTEEKKASLLELAKILNIPLERHKTEIRRAINDEILNTVTYRLAGPEQSFAWMKEGRRIIPILPRVAPVTGLTPIAKKGAAGLAIHNNPLLPPSQTASLPPPPRLQKPAHLLPPPTSEFVKPEPVQQNGIMSPPEIKTEIQEEDMENENGFVVLPSGLAVRLRDGTPPPGKRGKRKRSASKSIDIFPGGLAQFQAGMKLRDGKSPPRKISSVLGAGHGYARPLPTNSAQQPLVSAPSQAAQTLQPKSSSKVIVMPDQSVTPTKRGPGRPPGPASPQIAAMPAAGTVYQTTRGRPRLINPGMSTRPRMSRPRGPRPGVVITPRLTAPSPTILPASAPVFISQSNAVQVTIPQAFHPLPPPPRLALRPTAVTVASPRSTTIQLKQESAHSNPSLQGLKVISHSTTKIVPKSATAVYVVPSGSRPSAPQQRIVAVNSSGQRVVTTVSGLSQTQRVINPNLPGVIRTVRARQPISGKPSVIVVQKGAPQSSGIRAANPATVALYRPARAVVCGPRMGTVMNSGAMTATRPGDLMNAVRLPRPVTPRQATPGHPNSNVIVLDLSQDQPNSALANILSASGLLSDGSNNTNSSIIVSSSSGLSSQFTGSVSTLSGSAYNMTSAALNNTSVTGLTRTLPTTQRRIFVQRPASSGPSTDQLWIQGVHGTNNLNHDNQGQVVSIAPSPGTSSIQAGVSSMNSNNHSNYTDIFSAALEQADISLDSQNFIVDPNSSSIPNSTHATASQIFHLATTTGGRIVTLPHRPTFAKGAPQLAPKLPLHTLHAPPGDVMPRKPDNEGTENITDSLEDMSPFLSDNNGQNSSGERQEDQF